MADEKGRNKKKREQKKIERLSRLLGIDLCACSASHQSKCDGVCRKCHTDPNTGKVECDELYQIDRSVVKQNSPRRPRRDWKYGRQKEGNENKQAKDRRRERLERDRS